MPAAVFTEPQIASVGLTERQARGRGGRYVVRPRDYGDTAAGWAREDTTGILQGAGRPGDRAAARRARHRAGGRDGDPAADPGHVVRAPAHEVARGQYWIHPALSEVVENALLKLGCPTAITAADSIN